MAEPRPVDVYFTHERMEEMRRFAAAVHENKGAPVAEGGEARAWPHRNLLGAVGSAATAKVLHVPWDQAIYHGSDPGWDLVYRDTKIDAKHLQKWLLFNDVPSFKADVAVLVNPTENAYHVRVMGWIDRVRFFEKCADCDLGRGPRLFVPAGDLYDMRELLHPDDAWMLP